MIRLVLNDGNFYSDVVKCRNNVDKSKSIRNIGQKKPCVHCTGWLQENKTS